jgi:hypothetical protein
MLQPKHDPAFVSARPECKHGSAFVGLYGEPLHMICQCQPSAADARTHEMLRAKGWFKTAVKSDEQKVS